MTRDMGTVEAVLSELLPRYECRKETAYAAQMWRYVLRWSSDTEAIPLQCEQCDAIPYLPITPEDYALQLTSSSRILDVGCLGGYGLYDIAKRLRSQGMPVPRMTGVDLDPNSVEMARSLAEVWAVECDVTFGVMSAEDLALDDASFDLVISRLVLPYTDVRKALSSMQRRMERGGLLILQVHSPIYYLRQAAHVSMSLKSFVYYLRPVLVWFFYALTGKQIKRRGRSAETALSLGLLKREAQAVGLSIESAMGGAAKPIYILRRSEGGKSR